MTLNRNMKASIVIICVFTILCCDYTETYKVTEKVVDNVTANQEYNNPGIAKHLKVVNNETVLIENDKKRQVYSNNQNPGERSSGESEYNDVLNSKVINKDEYIKQGRKKLSNRPHRRNPKHIGRNETRKDKTSFGNDRGPRVIKQMSSLSIYECSTGKERADDGTCVSIEITADSNEIIDIEISTRGNGTEATTEATSEAAT